MSSFFQFEDIGKEFPVDLQNAYDEGVRFARKLA